MRLSERMASSGDPQLAAWGRLALQLEALQAAERVVDAWRAGDQSQLESQLEALAEALARLRQAIGRAR